MKVLQSRTKSSFVFYVSLSWSTLNRQKRPVRLARSATEPDESPSELDAAGGQRQGEASQGHVFLLGGRLEQDDVDGALFDGICEEQRNLARPCVSVRGRRRQSDTSSTWCC
jgi:hypothetical protein